MGQCANRPSKGEIEAHKNEENHSNDAYFRCFYFSRAIETSIRNEKNIHTLQSKQQILRKKILEFQGIMESVSHGVSASPELIIEIQKGVNLQNSAFCMNMGRPYVQIRLVPENTEYTTFMAEYFKPDWYQLFQIKQTKFQCTQVIVAAYLRHNIRGDTLVGEVKFNFVELQDQILKEGWFDLESKFKSEELIPALRMRVQFIHDEAKLYEHVVRHCEEKIKEIDRLIEYIHDTCYHSD